MDRPPTSWAARLARIGGIGLAVLIALRLWSSPTTNWPVMFWVLAGALAGIGFGCFAIAFMPEDSGGTLDAPVGRQLAWFAFLLGTPILLVVTWSKGIGNVIPSYWDTISSSPEYGVERTSPGEWFALAFLFGALVGGAVIAEVLSHRR